LALPPGRSLVISTTMLQVRWTVGVDRHFKKKENTRHRAASFDPIKNRPSAHRKFNLIAEDLSREGEGEEGGRRKKRRVAYLEVEAAEAATREAAAEVKAAEAWREAAGRASAARLAAARLAAVVARAWARAARCSRSSCRCYPRYLDALRCLAMPAPGLTAMLPAKLGRTEKR